jgi:hypothetical protein
MLVKHFFRFKKVAVAIDNHKLSFAFLSTHCAYQSAKLIDADYVER